MRTYLPAFFRTLRVKVKREAIGAYVDEALFPLTPLHLLFVLCAAAEIMSRIRRSDRPRRTVIRTYLHSGPQRQLNQLIQFNTMPNGSLGRWRRCTVVRGVSLTMLIVNSHTKLCARAVCCHSAVPCRIRHEIVEFLMHQLF